MHIYISLTVLVIPFLQMELSVFTFHKLGTLQHGIAFLLQSKYVGLYLNTKTVLMDNLQMLLVYFPY